jgi:hypothetical protein
MQSGGLFFRTGDTDPDSIFLTLNIAWPQINSPELGKKVTKDSLDIVKIWGWVCVALFLWVFLVFQKPIVGHFFCFLHFFDQAQDPLLIFGGLKDTAQKPQDFPGYLSQKTSSEGDRHCIDFRAS